MNDRTVTIVLSKRGSSMPGHQIMTIRRFLGGVAVGSIALTGLAACGSSSNKAASSTSAAATTNAAAPTSGAATTAAAASTTASSGASATQAATCASTKGISGKTITVGFLDPQSGAASATFIPFNQGMQARLQQAGDTGEANGFKFAFKSADDQNKADQNLAGARQLVEQDNVFAIGQYSPVQTGSADYLQQAGTPLFVHPVGVTFTDPKYNNVFGVWGPTSPTQTGNLAAHAKFLKDSGVTKMALIGFNVPSSVNALNLFKQKMEAAGIQVPVVDTSAAFGATDFTAQAAKAKQAGVDGVFVSVTTDAVVSIRKALAQAGLTPKVYLSTIGYDPRVIQAAGADAEGVTVPLQTQPFETNSAAMKAVADGLSKYQSSAPHNDAATDGWVAGEMLVEGIKAAGPCPTQSTVVSALRGMPSFDAGGILSQPMSLVPAQYFPYTASCDYFVTVNGGKFVPANSSKPVCPS
jgi:ABC-type branched-subunit amino acid transport system substrate-binding protein